MKRRGRRSWSRWGDCNSQNGSGWRHGSDWRRGGEWLWWQKQMIFGFFLVPARFRFTSRNIQFSLVRPKQSSMGQYSEQYESRGVLVPVSSPVRKKLAVSAGTISTVLTSLVIALPLNCVTFVFSPWPCYVLVNHILGVNIKSM